MHASGIDGCLRGSLKCNFARVPRIAISHTAASKETGAASMFYDVLDLFYDWTWMGFRMVNSDTFSSCEQIEAEVRQFRIFFCFKFPYKSKTVISLYFLNINSVCLFCFDFFYVFNLLNL